MVRAGALGTARADKSILDAFPRLVFETLPAHSVLLRSRGVRPSSTIVVSDPRALLVRSEHEGVRADAAAKRSAGPRRDGASVGTRKSVHGVPLGVDHEPEGPATTR